jgi:nicotinamide-nucleotide amidase
MPGPPREMKPMFENHVLPRIQNLGGETRFATRMLRVAGIGESQSMKRSRRSTRSMRTRRRQFSSTAARSRFTCARMDAPKPMRKLLLDDLALKIEKELGNSAFSFRGETMEEVVGRRLTCSRIHSGRG